MRAISCAVFAALLVACWAPSRPAAPRRDAPITLPVEQLELANGLRVVVVPEPSVAEVSITMRYAVGSADDPAGKAGLAHVVEHLMFEHVRGDEALFDFLERRALAFNGLTTPDATVYSERGTVAELEELLEVEAARLLGPCDAIPASAFARQREIVRNELRERAPGERVQAVLHEALFARPRESSTAESVATITQEDACSFAAARYAANNAVLVISGSVRTSDIRPLLDRTVGRVPRVGARERPRALELARTARRSVTLEAPVDRTWFLLAWPLPPDLAGRTRLRAVAAMATSLVSADVNGIVTSLEIGTGAARHIAIAVAPSKDITMGDALDSTKDALARIGPWFGSGLYEHAKNRAIHRFAASLDHGGDRDLMLASEAAAALAGGADVRATLDQALHGLATMSRDEAEQLAHTGLDPTRATIVTLRPVDHASDGSVVTSLAVSFHEARRRKLEDPADARRPLDAPVPANPLARASMQTLANGLGVVLLPLSTMPTVDIRLVLPVGTADEPTGQRGIALVAAHALDAPFDATMFQFLQGGGRIDEDVGFDQTVFSTRGLASRVDLLLAGLATTVREGTYDLDGVRRTANWLTLTSSSDAGAHVAIGAWREAVYGPEHPYRFASQWQHVQREALDVEALLRFRAQHYQPAGATLVIAGNFDPANAARWVEYHFQDWPGSPASTRTPRRDRRADPRALAFAQRADQAQLSIQLAFALPGDDRVAQDLVAEVVSETVADVREQLAASYGLHALLVRHRLAPPTLELAGSIDASRATEALALLRDRLAQLRARDAATAALFVSARRRVVARLSSVDTRADALADRITIALETGDTPSLGLADAERARKVTLDQLQSLLDRLDLAQATILVRGPESAITAAYAAIGRRPAFLH